MEPAVQGIASPHQGHEENVTRPVSHGSLAHGGEAGLEPQEVRSGLGGQEVAQGLQAGAEERKAGWRVTPRRAGPSARTMTSPGRVTFPPPRAFPREGPIIPFDVTRTVDPTR